MRQGVRVIRDSSVWVRGQDSDLLDLEQVLRRMSPAAVLSHRSAARAWGIWQPRYDGIEISTPAGPRGSRYTTSVQRRTVTAHRRIVRPYERVVRLGLPVTTLERTWLDLAHLLELPDLIAAGDSVLRLGASPASLAEAAQRARGVRGVRRARVVLPLLDACSRSRPESRLRAALLLAGLPRPEVNRPIFDDQHGWLAEPDLHYLEARLAIEYNGEQHAERDRMVRDSTRLLQMQRAGWEVRTYTAVDAFKRLDEVVLDVRSLLRLRAPGLLAACSSDPVTDPRDERRRSRRH